MLRAAAARPKLSLVTSDASSSRHRSRASLCEGSRMCCTVTSRVASFTFPTTSSSQPIAGADGTRRHAAARAVGGTAAKQAASIAFEDSRRSASAGRLMVGRRAVLAAVRVTFERRSVLHAPSCTPSTVLGVDLSYICATSQGT